MKIIMKYNNSKKIILKTSPNAQKALGVRPLLDVERNALGTPSPTLHRKSPIVDVLSSST